MSVLEPLSGARYPCLGQIPLSGGQIPLVCGADIPCLGGRYPLFGRQITPRLGTDNPRLGLSQVLQDISLIFSLY